AGPFRARYDQLYQEADREGMLREASYEDVPEYMNMADMAVRVWQYDADQDRRYYGSEASVGRWAKKQEDLGNKLFFVEAQRAGAEHLRKEMIRLKEDWKTARAEYFKTMEADPYKDHFSELDRRAAFMTDTLRREYESNRQALPIAAQSGSYEHCLGEIVESSTYTAFSENSGFSPPPTIYQAGDAGTVEALPGMGFRMPKPAVFDRIKAAQTDIPEEFPLDLPLKFDPLPYIKTEIECQKIKIKAEKDAIIAMGTYLTGLKGTGGLLVGEGFNVFHGVCEGFGSVGNILLGIGYAQLHPIEAYEKLNKTKNDMVYLWESSDAKQALIEKGVGSIADYFRGIGSGFNLLLIDDPPDGVYDRQTMEDWRQRAEETQLARKMLTNTEMLVGSILADVATGVILSRGSQAAKLAAEAADTAGDLSQAAARAKKLEEAAARAGKTLDDVPSVKTVEHLADDIRKNQDALMKLERDLSGKTRDIPYDPKMLRTPEDLLADASTVDTKGGMNAYVRLNEDLGMKVSNQPIIKGDTPAAVLSRKSRDLDDAGRVYLQDITKDSSIGRLPQVKDRYYIVQDASGAAKTVRNLAEIPDGASYKVVDVMEHIPSSMHADKLAGAQKLTADHVRAYEAFMRDMNAKGYVWTDNKLSNFAFETVDEAKGVYRVVPLDTGGFYKVGDLPSGVNMSKADFARKMQRAYDKGVEANVEGAPGKMLAVSQNMVDEGIPESMLDQVDDIMGVRKINPQAEQMVNTWDSGYRMSSPKNPQGQAYSHAGDYARESGKADDVLTREVSEAAEASQQARKLEYAKTRASLDAQKVRLEQINSQLDAGAQKLVQADIVEKSAAATAARTSVNTAREGVQTVAGIQAAQERILCLEIKEKILSGIQADWITEGWKNCQKLGLTFEGGR
ncbi:MAG: hypothetical protein WC345_07295, partial [Smithellaceae bacterium]